MHPRVLLWWPPQRWWHPPRRWRCHPRLKWLRARRWLGDWWHPSRDWLRSLGWWRRPSAWRCLRPPNTGPLWLRRWSLSWPLSPSLCLGRAKSGQVHIRAESSSHFLKIRSHILRQLSNLLLRCSSLLLCCSSLLLCCPSLLLQLSLSSRPGGARTPSRRRCLPLTYCPVIFHNAGAKGKPAMLSTPTTVVQRRGI